MPGNAGAIRAGRAFVELFADDKALQAGLRGAQAKLKAFGASVTKIGALMSGAGVAITTPLLLAAKDFSHVGAEIHDASIRTGIGAQALSELGFAAQQAGTDLAGVETGVKFLQKNLIAAGAGSEEARNSFRALGLNLAELQAMKPEDQFLAVGNALNNLQDDTAKTAVALRLFGRSGTQLLPLFAEGADGIAALRKEARKTGQTFSKEMADNADILDDALGQLTGTLKGIKLAIGAALAPTLTRIAGILTNSAESVIALVEANQGLVLGVLAGGAALATFGPILSTIGIAAIASSAAIGALATVLVAVATPIGFVVGALAVGTAAFLKFSKLGQDTLVELQNRFGEMGDTARAVMDGIREAITAGDLPLAMRVLTAGLALEFRKGIQPLTEIWQSWSKTFSDIANTTFHGFLLLANDAKFAWQDIWNEAEAGAKNFGEEQGTFFATLGQRLAQGRERLAAAIKFETGQITDEEFQQEKERIRAAFEAATKDAVDASKATLEALDSDKQRRSAEIRADQLREEAAILERMKIAKEELNRLFAEGAAADKAALQRAKDELAAAIAAAKAARKPLPKPKDDGKQGKDLAGVLASLGNKTSAAGTFNPFGIAGLGGQNPLLAESKKQTAMQAKIKDGVDQIGKNFAVFGALNF